MSTHRDRVLQVTWNWRAAPAASRSGTAALRRAAGLQAAVMGAVAALLHFGLGHLVAGRIVALLGLLVLVLGLAAPAAYRPLHRFGQALGRGAGTVLVPVVLVPFFFLVVAPVALWLRLRGRDPLHRTRRDPGHTYWIPRAPQDRADNIDRQFLREDREARGLLRPVGSRPERNGEPGA